MPATSIPATLTFESVAKEIIKETISNALFVDDKALEPFKSKSKKLDLRVDHERSLQLFKDFKSHDCLLHTAKFTKAGWKRDRKFNLNNKDLLILDWQLVGDDHQEALKILDESVLKKGIHFVCIYTQASLQEVRNELNRYYQGKVDKEKIEEIRDRLADTELEGMWDLEIESEDWRSLDELINNISNARETDIDNEIEEFKITFNLNDEVINNIKLIDSNPKLSFIKLRSALSKYHQSFSSIINNDFVFRPSLIDSNTFYINHTIVKLFEKNSLNGNQLYDAFVNSILEEGNIFLTLMGLEMRNRFRENSAFIGKDLDGVSEEAFFYHKSKNQETPHIFIDFLREILKDQVASFLYEKDLKIFEKLDDYSEIKGMNARINRFQGDNRNFVEQSFKLNKFYNLINITSRKANDLLRFGDVFKGTFSLPDKDGNITDVVKYFICITALCDCLRPDKIKNQFWFVEGKEERSQDSALRKTDGKFISFLPNGNNVIAVDWKNGKEFCMPFAMQIMSSSINEGIMANYYGENIRIELVGSIKENYTQRIANEAFGYPIRVGIDFVKKS